jgi:aspartate/methionine/tyrosine aminotransferase
MLTTFSNLEPVWIGLPAANGFTISARGLEDRVVSDRLGALLISNPCNPTGAVVSGDDLRGWVEMSRRRGCTLLMDEFYSHYHYTGKGDAAAGPVSSASYVEDVNSDPVVIIDGLTKCYRYPGWRVGWVVAAKDVIQRLTAAGSFLDGGPCRPIQRAAIEVLKPERADQETTAMRNEFAIKRKITLERLSELGVKFPGVVAGRASGTFYLYGDVSGLPTPINTGVGFMRQAFKHRVLTVPGEYFDVNPSKTHPAVPELAGFVRFSFGPTRTNLEAGLGRLGEMVRGLRK